MPAPWKVGDRVRLGSARGGVVVVHNTGKLRVQFPSGIVEWLDHCVPDDGPDGPIDINEWVHCESCDRLCPGPFCVNCRARYERDTRWKPAAAPAPDPPPPAPGVHLVGEDGSHCFQCGAALIVPSRGLKYPPGTYVERGIGWQAVNLQATAATCTPRQP